MKLLFILLPLLLATCTSVETRQAVSALTGVEMPATAPGEDVVRHLGYTAGYNHTTLCPDWVAWELTSEEAEGQNDGQYSFSRDPDVRFPKASREDYSHTGWDKGHMAPRADMRWSCQALEESYYFTNICPQDHTMNSQAWRKIEEMTRRVAKRYGRVWVVCGPVFADTGSVAKLGPAGVWVPSAFFKALAVSISDSTYATVAFLVENNEQTYSPRHYAVSVDSVEAVVGRDLFHQLPEGAEAAFDWNVWKY